MEEKDILDLANERFKKLMSAESEQKENFLKDIKFTYAIDEGQWDAAVLDERTKDKRPSLTFNKIRKFVAQVANRIRENRLVMDVIPVDDTADPAIASIYNGIIRNIEYQSDAQKAYIHGAEMSLAGGFGYWRLLTDYVDDGFDQEIRIKKIDNPLSVSYDPRRKYCFITDTIPLKEFKEEYKDVVPVDFDYVSYGQDWEGWYEDEKIRIAEYFTKEPVKKSIAQVFNSLTGETGIIEIKEDLGKIQNKIILENGEILDVLKYRAVSTHKVMWYKLIGGKILDKREWLGKNIPVIEVKGDEVNVAGKIHKRSLIRDAKSSQAVFNYWLTSLTEKVALSPKAPFILKMSWIKKFKDYWDNANIKNYPYLPVSDTADQLPKRQEPAQIEPGIMAILQIADGNIKDTLGMYEPTFGEPSNERSGVAITKRSQRSDLGTFHFVSNFSDAIMETARQMIDLIPKIYDTERIIRIRDYEGNEQPTPINYTIIDPETNTEKIKNDLSVGKYDIRANVKSFATRRQETNEFMLQALQYAPQIAPMILDLMFKYSDIPGAEEIENRIKQYLPALMGMQQGGGGKTAPEPAMPETQ